MFRHRELYEKELYAYFRLDNEGVGSIAGFNVPRLIGRSDALMVIEMEIVKPPFVVDFAGAVLDQPPAWLRENRQEWEDNLRELFDDRSRYERILALIAAFRRFGIFPSDVKPGNVMFGDEHLLD